MSLGKDCTIRSGSRSIIAAILLLCTSAAIVAQAAHEHTMDMHNSGQDPAAYLMRMASGTSMNPQAGELPMRMINAHGWMQMVMGQGFITDVQQSGPRGHDKLYSVNWAMWDPERRLGRGEIMFSAMFSLEPATISNRSYPDLFQTGETAYGVPLVDAQHPHNLFMGLGMHYAHPVAGHGIFQAYYAPVGDPALGPVAFPHRASARDIPQAPLGHHWEDSTHIAYNVATVAVQQGWLRAEASSFWGTEPGENRWTIDWGPMNSWSGRVSLIPDSRWFAQFSAGRLTHPERDQSGDTVRATASVAYARPLATGRVWASSIIWGRNHETQSGRNLNAFLAETALPFGLRNSLSGRVEMVAKDDLFANNLPLQQHLNAIVGSTFRVREYTGGYTRILWTSHGVETALGANMTAYGVPSPIQPYYGAHPFAANAFVRLRLAGR